MDKDKVKKIKDKMDAFMSEISTEFLDDETQQQIHEEVKRIFKVCEIPLSKMTLKAFREGVALTSHISRNGDLSQALMVMATMTKIISDLEEKTKKQVDTLATNTEAPKGDGQK